MNPRITVLMAVYNCEDTLVEALDSLFSQTYQDFKIVLCNDASTDNTFQIAKEYSVKHDNVILLNNDTNLKLAASLNRCLKYADTEYIARMDGDDISLPTRFEKELAFLDKHPEFALVSCAMIHFDENGDWGVGNPVEIPTKMDFRFGSPFAHAPSMIRTHILREVKGYTISERLVRGQDYYLWYKIFKSGYKGYNLPEPLYKMRDDKDAYSRRTLRHRWNGFLINIEVLKGLNIPNYALISFYNFSKVFIPYPLMKIIRRIRLGAKMKNGFRNIFYIA